MLSKLLGNPWALLLAVALSFGAGFALQGELKDGDIAEIHLAHGRELAAAVKAKADAEEATRLAEDKANRDLAALSDQYVKEQEHEKAAADQRIADLLTANVRLRVAVQRPAGGCAIPGAATTASGSDDQATEALPGPVAARLTRRYADYNAIVGQLTLCQDTIDRYLELAGPKPSQ